MDDFTFGTAVWADSPTSPPPGPSSLSVSRSQDLGGFDDFDDFGDPPVISNQDDFGDDFGDFGDAQVEERYDTTQFEEISQPSQVLSYNNAWEPLRLDPMPSASELSTRSQELLTSILPHHDPEKIFSGEGIRHVEGLAQILITPERRISRSLYHTLFQTAPPSLRPLNWTRSRIRRQHLISLGIPVNLDEVLPQANGKALPTLQITTRPSSAPPGPRPAKGSKDPTSGPNTRSGTPGPGSQPSNNLASLGPKPKLDHDKISEMLDLQPDTLTLLPVATLEAHLATLRSLTLQTSSLLTHLLQTREALQQDSETYNGLIAELVGEAQRMKSGPKGKHPPAKRGSGL